MRHTKFIVIGLLRRRLLKVCLHMSMAAIWLMQPNIVIFPVVAWGIREGWGRLEFFFLPSFFSGTNSTVEFLFQLGGAGTSLLQLLLSIIVFFFVCWFSLRFQTHADMATDHGRHTH